MHSNDFHCNDEQPLFEKNILLGRTAVVSGGGTGIGFAISRKLARLGARVAICARKTEVLEISAKKLRCEGLDVQDFYVNVRDENSIRELFCKLTDLGWVADILVNNAGGQFAAPALEITPNGFRSVVDLNLTGSWLMSSEFAHNFIKGGKRDGNIISIVLAQGSGIPGMVHAAAARSGVANMMKSLAYEWGSLGITANAIAPGTVDTPALARYDRKSLEDSVARLPVPRMASPFEIAAAVAYLVSPAARFITGVTLPIDGGEHMMGAQPQKSH